MGNSLQPRSNSLARNWTPVSPDCYRNLITGELIHSHTQLAHSEEELAFNNNLLIKRAGLAHPNVLKLIYFCTPPPDALCTHPTFTTKLYLEHAQAPLASLLQQPTSHPHCLCCPIVNGIRYLVQRYGPFRVGEESVWLVGQELRKRQVAKVWVHSDLKSSQPEETISEGEMSRQLVQLIEKLQCPDSQGIRKESFRKLEDVFQFVYERHNQQPVGHQNRKRVSSQAESHPVNQRANKESLLTASREPTLRTPKNQSLQHTAGSPIEGLSRKPVISLHPVPQVPDKKDIFYRPVQTNFSKKVNFSYANGTITPKQNQSFQHGAHQATSAQSSSSTSRPVRANHSFSSHHSFSSKTVQEPSRRIPLVSGFSQESDLLIEEEHSEDKLKDILGDDRNRSDSSKSTGQQEEEGRPQPFKSTRPVQREAVLNQEERPPAFGPPKPPAQKKESKLSLQKNFHLSIEGNNEQSVPDRKSHLTIGNNYRISVEPEAKSPEVQLPVEEAELPNPVQKGDSRQPRQEPPSGLNFHQNAFSEESRENRTPSHQPERHHSDEGSYLDYLQQLEKVRLAESEIPQPKVLYSERLPPSQLPSQPSPSEDGLATTINHLNREAYSKLHKGGLSKPRVNSTGEEEEEEVSLYNNSSSSEEERKKARLMDKIKSTEGVLRENRKKLERLQFEKDLEREKGLIKREMEELLVGTDDSLRIKEKVRHKRATFAQLKAEASKILEDLSF